ncbi:hypothetical protein [Acinetobacter sp. 8_A20231192]|uniref:hypothetical protein n=1 Tax=Acinetobacter sp. 8_A20231192 TaxID=3141545 RepID=UPI00320BAE70
MIKTPLSTVLGGAFWTPEATVINGAKLSFETVMKKLFANNEQGFAYDPNDLSTMFQDAAGTVPVTGVGQPVGLIRDKSGRNNHAYQTTSASRPILRQNAVTGAYYLELDGSDDFFVTNSIDFTATDKISLFTGARKLSDAGPSIFAELSADVNYNNGSFYLAAPLNATTKGFSLNAKGTSSGFPVSSSNAAPISAVVSGYADLRSTQLKLRINGALTTGAASLGTGNYGNHPLYIGRRGGTSLSFNGHIYSLIGIGRLTTDSETKALEQELAKRTGVTLNV